MQDHKEKSLSFGCPTEEHTVSNTRRSKKLKKQQPTTSFLLSLIEVLQQVWLASYLSMHDTLHLATTCKHLQHEMLPMHLSNEQQVTICLSTDIQYPSAKTKLQGLNKMIHLQRIRFKGNQPSAVFDAAAEVFSGCRILSISVEDCAIFTDKTMEIVASACPSLQSVNVNGCALVTGASLTSLATHCSGLTSVHMNYCGYVDPVAVTSVSSSCMGMKLMHFGHCAFLPDESVVALAHCSELTSIDISDSNGLTDVAVKALASGCPKLLSINLSGCSLLTNLAIKALALNCPGLQSINCSKCVQLTDAAVVALGSNCYDLISIDLSFCGLLTDLTITLLSSNCPNLEYVDLDYCMGMDYDRVVSFQSHCASMKAL